MRLIDADALVREIEKKLHEGEYQVRWMRNGKTLTQGILYGLDGARRIILKQPTAYDQEKVVSELDKLADKANDKILEAGELQLYYDGYEDGMRTAVEVVKGGGVDAF